jgi:hypothetical protein
VNGLSEWEGDPMMLITFCKSPGALQVFWCDRMNPRSSCGGVNKRPSRVNMKVLRTIYSGSTKRKA